MTSAATEVIRRCLATLPSSLPIRGKTTAAAMELLESRTLLAATFQPLTFVDPFPVPAQQGAAVVAPVFTETFDTNVPANQRIPGVIGSGWSAPSGAAINLSTPAALQGFKSAMTIEFWSKGTIGGWPSGLVTGPGFGIIGDGGYGAFGGEHAYFTMARDGKFIAQVHAYALLTNPSDGLWHHYAFTNDCRYLSIYVDGELYSRQFISNNANQIAPMEDGTGAVLHPNITLGQFHPSDELRIYDKALTPVQVRQNYENYRTYANTWYASPSGSAGAAGTLADPLSLATALSRVGADTRIILKPGTYDGAQFQVTTGGSEALHNALIMGQPGSAPSIIRTTSGSVGPKVSGAGWVTLRNLQFVNTSASTANALTIGTIATTVTSKSGTTYYVPHTVMIDSCQVSSDTGGILVTGAKGVHVQNTAVQAASTGISFVASPQSVVRNNTVYGGTTGLSFTSTSNYLHTLANLVTGQSSRSLVVDATSAKHGSVGDAWMDSNVYSTIGGTFATFNGIAYTNLLTYQTALYRLNYPGNDVQWTPRQLAGYTPELHSLIRTPTYNSTSSSTLDLGLQKIAGNPIDAATVTSLLTHLGDATFTINQYEPTLYDATGIWRPLGNPFDNSTATGGNAPDVGAYETAGWITYSFTLPATATSFSTSAGVYKPDGTLVRTLWSARTLPAGANVAYWNGLDDSGQAVADTGYQIKVIAHNVNYVWEGAVGNTSDNYSGPTTYRGTLDGPTAIAITGTKGYLSFGHNEGQPQFIRFDTAAPQQIQAKMAKGSSYLKPFEAAASDGTRTYFAAPYDDPWGDAPAGPGMIIAYNVSDDSAVVFSSGTWMDSNEYQGIRLPVVLDKVSLAVQTSGNILFVSAHSANQVYLYDKTTGAKLSTTISISSPGQVAATSNGDLWVTSGTMLYRYSASNNWAASVQSVNLGASAVVAALSYTTYEYGQSGSTGTLLVADGALTSQQIKAFRNDNGAAIWTLGQASGYALGPTVANDKFQFGKFVLNGTTTEYHAETALGAQADGSFWIHERATQRLIKFDANRSLQTFVGMARSNYSICTDQNNASRVFGAWVEYSVDYSKPLAGTNGSWTPVKYWGHNQPEGYRKGLDNVTTMSNGRTYGVLDGTTVVELTASGLRNTGKTISGWIEPDGSISAPTQMPSTTATFKKQSPPTFDGSGNPVWTTATTVTAVANPNSQTNLFAQDPLYMGAWHPGTGGVVITQNPGTNVGYHLGAVRNGQWLWKAMPTSALDGKGAWDSQAGYAGLDNAAVPVVAGRNIFVGYKGEFWHNSQANQYMNFYDNGLLVGQFGQSGFAGDQYYSAVPGVTSNANEMQIVRVQVGDQTLMHMYVNDESGVGGVHRWRVDGWDAILEFTSGTLVTLPAPSNIAAVAVSTSQINLTWADNSNDETGFKVDRATNSTFTAGLTTIIVSGANVTSYSDTGLAPGTYYYRVRANNASAESANSNVALANTSSPLTLPAAPTALMASAVSASRVDLSWTDNASNEAGFILERATNPDFSAGLSIITISGADVTSYSDIGLSASTTYYYRLRSTNSLGDSANTPTVSATTQALATTTPVGQYQADEGSGATVNDTGTGTAANGTIVGGVTRISGQVGSGALSFDGTSGYVDLGNPSKLNFSGQITLSAWVRPGVISGNSIQNILAHGATFSPNAEVSLRIDNGQYSVGSWNGLDANAQYAVPAGDLNAWVHLAGVYDGSAWRLYRNGVQVAQATAAVGSITVAANWTIGAGSNGGRYFRGEIDDVKLFNAGLSAAQVAALATLPALVAPSDLTATAASSSQINLSWVDNSSGETGFKIERATDPNFTENLVSAILAPGATTYAATVLSLDTTYYFRVAAMGSQGNSVYATAVAGMLRMGDANLDSQIDLTDLTILAGNWQLSGQSFADGDFSGDGIVDLTDLTILAGQWQSPPPAPMSTVVLDSQPAVIEATPAVVAEAQPAEPTPVDAQPIPAEQPRELDVSVAAVPAVLLPTELDATITTSEDFIESPVVEHVAAMPPIGGAASVSAAPVVADELGSVVNDDAQALPAVAQEAQESAPLRKNATVFADGKLLLPRSADRSPEGRRGDLLELRNVLRLNADADTSVWE